MNFFQAYGRYFDYLSGGSGDSGIPVVELTNPVVMEQFAAIELTEADKEALENAVAADKPIYLKFKNEQDITYEAFADIMRFETGFQVSVTYHQLAASIVVVTIGKEEDEWFGALTYTQPESTTAETAEET